MSDWIVTKVVRAKVSELWDRLPQTPHSLCSRLLPEWARRPPLSSPRPRAALGPGSLGQGNPQDVAVNIFWRNSMNIVTVEEIARRQRRAEEWIAEADKHVRTAKYLLKKDGIRNLTLAHVQQSMEMATKGLARASGVPHRELQTEIGHNNLFLFTKIIEIVIDSMEDYKRINDVLGCSYREGKNYDVAKHIQNVLTATASPRHAKDKDAKQYAREIFDSGKKMTPDEVKFMLDSFDRITGIMRVPSPVQGLIRKITSEPVNVRRPVSGSNWMDDIVVQATQQLSSRIGAQADPAAVTLLQDIARSIPTSEEDMTAELEENNGRFYFDGDQLIEEMTGMLSMMSANMGLLIIGSLVWAHESYPRYPADPDAPDSIELAVKQRQLGTKHYANDMGVIRHIKPLIARADRTIRSLKKGYKAGYLLMGTKDVNSLRS